jgi:hypothetical protein
MNSDLLGLVATGLRIFRLRGANSADSPREYGFFRLYIMAFVTSLRNPRASSNLT